jgi:uncharacterized protein YdiU (UPF0061 family)
VEFANTYANLPAVLFKPADSTAVTSPKFVAVNHALAREIGISETWLQSPEALQSLSGNTQLPNTSSIAMAYAGHQFGHWVPSLGDGRAILAGEVMGPDDIRRDLHLKGAGRTPYSRNGDGRATLGAMLREYIVSEAMHALGIPTTRSLAVVATGENIMREGLFFLGPFSPASPKVTCALAPSNISPPAMKTMHYEPWPITKWPETFPARQRMKRVSSGFSPKSSRAKPASLRNGCALASSMA